MYSFESSSDQPEQEDKAIYFVHPQEQLTQLANEFNIRYSPTFDPASQNTFSVNQDLLQTNNNAQYELPSFHAFHGVSQKEGGREKKERERVLMIETDTYRASHTT